MLNKIHNPDILTCLANLSNDEVFTPPNIAKQMLDTLPQELFTRKDTKFLDPFTKSGVFLREIAIRLIKGLEQEIPDLQERVNHIMQYQIYGIGITELTALLARRTLYCAKNATSAHSVTPVFENENGNIAFDEIQHTWDNNGKCIYCGTNQKTLGDSERENLESHAYQFIHNKNPFKDMQFDVIIGNPPYQLNDGGGMGAAAMPIYQKFIEQAIKLRPHYLCMITPSRWFTGGRGLDGFRDKMLNDKRLKEIHDYPTASEVFPGVEIKGGVNYFLWQSDYNGNCLIKTYEEGKCISEMKRPLLEDGLSTFVRDNYSVSILKKVMLFKEKVFSTLISSNDPFGFDVRVKGSYKRVKPKYKLKKSEGLITFYYNGWQNKGKGYINSKEIRKNLNWIDDYKILFPKAWGTGNPKSDWLNPFIVEPPSCCTETYLVIGPFHSKRKGGFIISYMNTRFFHFLVSLIKNTQNAMKKVYSLVPIQNFDEEWTDEKLYAKYGLTEDEIAYIESMIRPME